MQSRIRDDLRAIFDSAVAAVDPAVLISRAVGAGPGGSVVVDSGGMSLGLGGAVRVIGAGKASARMAAAFDDACGASVKLSGVVVVPEAGAAADAGRVRLLPGEHPIPGPLGLAASAQLVAELGADPVDQVVCLLSGGASSLLVAPLPPLTLDDKQRVSRILLHCGAPIEEVNRVRKHLSAVKGGRLLRRVGNTPVLSLLISDVVGDDPATIGSGPTVPDSSSFSDAIEVLEKYGVYEDCPAAVRSLLERGRRGEVDETVRPGSAPAQLATSIVLGSNGVARRAAAEAAGRLGYRTEILDEPLVGDTCEAASGWLRAIRQSSAVSGPVCCIAGGETTVRVEGRGKGGRNQEFALALVEAVAGLPVSVLSAGTDGIDGPTEAAGAYVDGTTLDRASDLGLDPSAFLRDNDSFSFFNRLGDLLVTGPTATNVTDLKLAIVRPPSAG